MSKDKTFFEKITTPYSAPAVAVKQGSNITYLYLLRDYLGTITHVVDASNNIVVAEYSFDAC